MRLIIDLVPYLFIAIAWMILATYSMRKSKGLLDLTALVVFLSCSAFLGWEIIIQHGLMLLYIFIAIIIGILSNRLVNLITKNKKTVLQ